MAKPEIPDLLLDFRTVQANPAASDESQSMKDLRALKKIKPVEFMTQWTGLERDWQRQLTVWRKSREQAKSRVLEKRARSGVALADEGTDKALELARKLLADYGAKEGEGL